MARPERNTVDYYPFFVGEGKKMFFIEKKYGNDGYATWCKILDKLCTTEFHYLNLNANEEIMFLAAKCNISEETLLLIIQDLVKLNVFDKELWESKILWNQKFVDSIEDAYKKRNNKCITIEGLRILLKGLGILKTKLKVNIDANNPQSKVKKSKEKEIKEENIYRFFAHLKLSNEEFDKLIELNFSKVEIDNILDSIENYKKNTSYKSLFLTAKKWLEKEKSSAKKENPQSVIEKAMNRAERNLAKYKNNEI